MRVAGHRRRPTGCSKDIWHKAKEAILTSPLRSEGSQGDQAGDAGPLDWRPRVLELNQGTIRFESTQIRSFS
jgi:hypothetical protein